MADLCFFVFNELNVLFVYYYTFLSGIILIWQSVFPIIARKNF